MAWRVLFTGRAQKSLAKLDKQVARRILAFLEQRVIASGDPRLHGKALTGALGDLWRYRVGDYRLICRIEDDALIVLVLTLGHRGGIYD